MRLTFSKLLLGFKDKDAKLLMWTRVGQESSQLPQVPISFILSDLLSLDSWSGMVGLCPFSTSLERGLIDAM